MGWPGKESVPSYVCISPRGNTACHVHRLNTITWRSLFLFRILTPRHLSLLTILYSSIDIFELEIVGHPFEKLA